jgi:hypothetical protein
MRKLTIATGAAILLAGISLANAASVIGTIKSIDAAGGTVTLEDGKAYKLPTWTKASNWKVGDKVMVTLDDKNVAVIGISKV